MKDVLKTPIILKSDKPRDVITWIDRILELFVRVRPQILKNYPKGNFLLVKAVACTAINFAWLVVMPVMVIQYFRHENFSLALSAWCASLTTADFANFFLTLAGAIALVFWNLGTEFNRKWAYCSNLFNTIVTTSNQESTALSNLNCCLALDLLKLDLWAHSSFREFFSIELSEAVRDWFIDHTHFEGMHRNQLNHCINADELTEGQAMVLLSSLREKLALILSGEGNGVRTETMSAKYIANMKSSSTEAG